MRIALRSSCVHLEASLCQGKVRPHTSCCLVTRIPVSSPVHNHCKFRFHPPQRKIFRGKNRYVDELHPKDSGHNPTISELLLERSVARDSKPCSTEMEQSCIEETPPSQFEIPTNPVYYSKEVVPVGERKWEDILACESYKGDSLSAEISKLVMRLVPRYDQDERETDGAVHWKSMGPKLRRAFQKAGGRNFSDSDWLQQIYEGSNKTRFQYCMNSRDFLLYIRAIQGHTGGNLIASELMGQVPTPYKGKEFLFHRGCSFLMLRQSSNQDSSLEDEKVKKEDRPSSSHLSKLSGRIQTKKNLAMTSQRREKVHYYCEWKNSHDALYWINLARAQDKGLRFLQTRSHAAIVHRPVPADCICKVISQKR